MPEPTIHANFFDQEEVRLISRDGAAGNVQHGVRFFVTPELSESRTVLYDEMSDIRFPGGMLIYIGTQLRTYSITAKMISRTRQEADLTYTYTHILKSWTMPSKFGTVDALGTGGQGGGENTPEILRLYAYGKERQIRGVPVVMTSLNIDYPSNITYITKSDNKTFVPIVQTFTIGLKEARNWKELSGEGDTGFKIEEYKQGILPAW
jgi:hypothetical protein